MVAHTEFKFHAKITQLGCYWEGGGHTELYLLEGEQLAIIDTGCLDTPALYIAPALRAMGRDLSDVALIINTHGHHDHAGGNAALVAASGAQVWLHEADVAIAEDLDRQFAEYFAQNATLVGREDQLAELRAHLTRTADPTKVDRTLKGGEQLDLGRGIVLTVIPTPGHTRGSVSLFWEREGILFTGDSLPGAGSRDGGMPLIYQAQAYEETLDRLAEVDFATLCLGHHYRSLTLTRDSVKYGEVGKRYLAECKEIATLIADGMRAALVERPEASFLEAARAALPAIGRRIPLTLNPETGLPVAGPTAVLYTNWQRLQAG